MNRLTTSLFFIFLAVKIALCTSISVYAPAYKNQSIIWKKKFDYIITKRSIQNLTSWNDQKKFINQLKFFSNPKTKILLMESSNDGLKKINDMRSNLN